MTIERQYSLPEAADILGYAVTTLRDRVARGEVPHHRRFGVKGVYFTDNDMAAIQDGTRVPLGDRRRRRGDHRRLAEGAGSTESPELAAFFGLRSLRST